MIKFEIEKQRSDPCLYGFLREYVQVCPHGEGPETVTREGEGSTPDRSRSPRQLHDRSHARIGKPSPQQHAAGPLPPWPCIGKRLGPCSLSWRFSSFSCSGFGEPWNPVPRNWSARSLAPTPRCFLPASQRNRLPHSLLLPLGISMVPDIRWVKTLFDMDIDISLSVGYELFSFPICNWYKSAPHQIWWYRCVLIYPIPDIR